MFKTDSEAAAAYKVPLEVNAYGFRKPKIKTKAGTRPLSPSALLGNGGRVQRNYGHRQLRRSQAKDVGETATVDRIIDQFGLVRADLSYLEKPSHHPVSATHRA